VTRGLFPGSFLVPGTNTSFRFRGFVRATGLYDFNPIGSRDDFVTNTIPVPQQNGQNQNISARYSRIGLDTWTPTPFFEWNVHTFIEGDFFNGPAQAVGGGGTRSGCGSRSSISATSGSASRTRCSRTATRSPTRSISPGRAAWSTSAARPSGSRSRWP